ncbi:hypothetical protein M1814_000897 [Neofusicoccum parvum]|uniref:Uncharacterized protein n=1 Tax=Neofusicoccum parvum TaxID=310453 RepID=A0ACB5SBS9_9PEZI|nr:hypothetical protein M1814_000897 [Neofusicoccum parvum]
MLLAGITGSRPGALLALRYRDVQVTLIQDSTGSGRPLVLIELTYEYTKRYLGAKDSNTFPIPEIRYDPCLFLSPHTYFLALAFSNRAFAAPDLNRPEVLFKLRVVDGLMEARLLWKEEVLDLPIFRKSHHTVYDEISDSLRNLIMQYSKSDVF